MVKFNWKTNFNVLELSMKVQLLLLFIVVISVFISGVEIIHLK